MSTEITVEAKRLSEDATALAEAAKVFIVESDQDYGFAAEELKRIKIKADALDSERRKITRPLDEAKDRVMSFFKPFLSYLTDAEASYKKAMLIWDEKQRETARKEQQRREEEAARARQDAERRAAAERAKAQEEERKQREEAERKRKEAEEAQQREERARADGDKASADIAAKERSRALAAAAKADEKAIDAVQRAEGRAAELENTAAQIVAPVVGVSTPQVKGVAYKNVWHAEVLDVLELCRAVVEGKVAPLAVEPNMKFLNQQAISLGEHFNIPGCKAKSERVISASKRG